MIFHVDANTFYASCERLFRPDLKNKPIVVLSNNDGIVIALTAEAKKLGLKRGDAYFKVRDFCNAKNVTVFSSNYTLYADISYRLNTIYSLYAERNEIYSIDESFLFFPDLINLDYTAFGRQLKNIVWMLTGIPISVGIAPTKTLAKMCNKFAKHYGGVFNWQYCPQEKILNDCKVEDIWNVGRSKAEWLKRNGVKTAFDLKNFPLDRAKKHLSINAANTIMELNGRQSINYIERPLSQNITCSRSFQKKVYGIEEIKKALAFFCTNATRKMRAEKQSCKSIYVTLGTSFPIEKEYDPMVHYFNGAGKKLSRPTSYLPDITSTAYSLLEEIYRSGYAYRKASVSLLELCNDSDSPMLFEDKEESRKQKSAKVFDAVCNINEKYGKDTVNLIMCGHDSSNDAWGLKQDFKSPDYTTDRKSFPLAR